MSLEEKKMRKAVAFLLAVCLTASLSGPRASTGSPAPAQAQEYYPRGFFSPEQLDNLLAPIALYPDPLLAQVLVAATFADQVEEAARWMRAYNNPYGIDHQPWDVSVKAVAHYPSVLYMMSDRIDWTIALGQAYVHQPADVMAAVQHLRAAAYSAGHLASNHYHEVIPHGDYIEIVPYHPHVLYVPVYEPQIVYFPPRSYLRPYPVAIISFGPPFPIGAWLNRHCDWTRRHIYYHGWRGRGWIARSRPHIHITNTYVNHNHTTIRINRDVVRRSVNLNNLNRYTSLHRGVNFSNLGRRNRTENSNPDTGDRIIRRNPDLNEPRFDNSRGRPPAEQPAAREQKPRRIREERLPQVRENKPPRTHKESSPRARDEKLPQAREVREERPPQAKVRPEASPPPPREIRQRPPAFGADRSFDPRAKTPPGRSRAKEPAPSRQDRGPGPQGERSKRLEPGKKT